MPAKVEKEVIAADLRAPADVHPGELAANPRSLEWLQGVPCRPPESAGAQGAVPAAIDVSEFAGVDHDEFNVTAGSREVI